MKHITYARSLKPGDKFLYLIFLGGISEIHTVQKVEECCDGSGDVRVILTTGLYILFNDTERVILA